MLLADLFEVLEASDGVAERIAARRMAAVEGNVAVTIRLQAQVSGVTMSLVIAAVALAVSGGLLLGPLTPA